MNPRNPQIQRRRQSQYRGIQYNYSTAAGDTFDFSQIGKDYVRNKEFQREAVEKVQKKIREDENTLLESSSYEMTGVAEVDKAAMNITGDIREKLLNSKKLVGKYDEKLKRMRTLKDHNALFATLNTSAKTYGEFNTHMTKEADRIMNDENISGADKERFTRTAASFHNPKLNNGVHISDDGRVVMTTFDKTPDGDGKRKVNAFDMGELMFNSAGDIPKYDPIATIDELQNVYAEKVMEGNVKIQNLEGSDRQAFLTEHVTRQTDQFESFKKNYIESFSNNKNKLISYGYDQMGIGYEDKEFTELDENGNPTNKKINLKLELNPKDGSIIMSPEVEQQIARRFGMDVDAAFGVKQKISGSLVDKKYVRASKGSDKNLKFSSQQNQHINGTQEGETNLNDITGAYQADLADVIKRDNNGEIIKGQETKTDPFQNADFRNNNSDYLDGNGNAATFTEYHKAPSVEEYVPGKQKTLGTYTLDMGPKFTAKDMGEMSLTSHGGREIKGVEGIQVTYNWVKLTDKDSEGNETYRMVRRPSGIHIYGSVMKRNTSAVTDVQRQEGESGAADMVHEAKTTEQTQKSHHGISNKLSQSQILNLVTKMEKSYPGVVATYDNLTRTNKEENRLAMSPEKAFVTLMSMDKYRMSDLK